MREDQPSGPNPEWEQNREQNIAIAKRIESLLLDFPDPMDLEIKSQEKLGIRRRLQEWGDMGIYHIARDMLIHGYNISLKDANNPGKGVSLGIAQDIKLEQFNQESMERLMKVLKFPVYSIREYSDPNRNPNHVLNVSSRYGDIPSDILGLDRVYYKINNVYYFNAWGQGAKLEDIYGVALADKVEDQGGLTKVNFIPSEEDSRVVPLTPDDYGKINKMFEDIDAGLYKA